MGIFPTEWLHFFHCVSGQVLEGGFDKSEGDALLHSLWVGVSHSLWLLWRRPWRWRLPETSLPKAERAALPQLRIHRGAGLVWGLPAQAPAPFLKDVCVWLWESPSYFPSACLTPLVHTHSHTRTQMSMCAHTHTLSHLWQLNINSSLMLSCEICTPRP